MARVSPARDSCKLAVDEQVPVRDGPRHDRCSTTAVRRGTTTYDVRTASRKLNRNVGSNLFDGWIMGRFSNESKLNLYI